MIGAAVATLAAVLGLYCLLRWAITAPAAAGRHRAANVPTAVLRASRLLADQDQAANERQAHRRAAVADEAGADDYVTWMKTGRRGR